MVGHILIYMVVPILLTLVHIVGDALQQTDTGPELIQNHLHNIGAPGSGLGFAGILVAWEIHKGAIKKGDQHRAAAMLTNWVFLGFCMAILSVVFVEIVDPILFREQLIAQGYSGQIDYFDLLAYMIGLLLMALNHILLRRVVLQRILDR